MAVESLLENYPEWRGKVVFFAIIRDRNRPGTTLSLLFLHTYTRGKERG